MSDVTDDENTEQPGQPGRSMSIASDLSDSSSSSSSSQSDSDCDDNDDNNEEEAVTSSNTQEDAICEDTMYYKDKNFFNIGLVNDNRTEEEAATNDIVPVPFIDYFRGYINQNFIAEIARCTNQRSIELCLGKCANVTTNEIENFIGVYFLMSIIKMPRIQMYWQVQTRFSVVADVMTEDRFLEIRSYLKVQDDNRVSEDMKKKDRLWKVRPILEEIRKRCSDLPRSQKVNINESIIPFRGRSKKSNACADADGLKMFVLTSSKGLILDFYVYHRQEALISTLEQLKIKPNRQLSLGEAIVLRFVLSIDPGASLYFDKYFTSTKLLEELFDRGINGTGIIKKNLLPKEASFKSKNQLRKEGHGASDVQVRIDKKFAITSWYDDCNRKIKYFVSNAYSAAPEDIYQRWSKTKNKYISVKRPCVVREYNNALEGIHVHNQVISYYRSMDETNKWTVKTILHMLDVVTFNSWMEYRLDLGDRDCMQYFDFKLFLALQLCRH